MTPGDIDFSDSNFVDDILENCNILRTRATKAEASLAEAEALIRKNADMINALLARIAELESQIIHQTAISACRIEERERHQKQIATLQEIAIHSHAMYLHERQSGLDWYECSTDHRDDMFDDARRQLAKEHPEAFL